MITVRLIQPKSYDGHILADRLACLRTSAPHDIRFLDVETNRNASASVEHYFKLPGEKISGVPAVYSVIATLSGQDGFISFTEKWRSLRAVDRIICVSPRQETLLVERGLTNVTVILPSWRACTHQDEPDSHKDSHLGVFIAPTGSVREEAGISYVVDVIKRLDPKKFRFAFVGPYWKSTALRSVQMGFDTQFLSRIPYRLHQATYRQAAFIINCSRSQGIYDYMEAKRSGRPLVCFPEVHHELGYPPAEAGLSGRPSDDARRIEQLSIGVGGRCLMDAQTQTSGRTWEMENQEIFDVYRDVAKRADANSHSAAVE